MEIKEKISSAISFPELLQIAEVAEVKISFWGAKYICVNGYDGTLDINALAARTLQLLKQTNYEFAENEREPGKRLAAKIDHIYEDGDSKLSQSPCFTKNIGWIRNTINVVFNYIFNGARSVRVQWQGPLLEPNCDFEYYTRRQFLNRYGFNPEDAARHGVSFIDINHSPPRWKIPPYGGGNR